MVWSTGTVNWYGRARVETWQLPWSPMDDTVWIRDWWTSRQLVTDGVERRGLSIKCRVCSDQWTTETVGIRSVDEHFRRIELVECHEYSWSAMSSTFLSHLNLNR